jgi:hypothetical protein
MGVSLPNRQREVRRVSTRMTKYAYTDTVQRIQSISRSSSKSISDASPKYVLHFSVEKMSGFTHSTLLAAHLASLSIVMMHSKLEEIQIQDLLEMI